MTIGVAADLNKAEVEAAIMRSDPVKVVATSGATAIVLAAARAGFRAALVGGKMRSSGAGNTYSVGYGASPTALTGNVVIADGESLFPTFESMIVGPVGESLTATVTQVAGEVNGHLIPIYIKDRS